MAYSLHALISWQSELETQCHSFKHARVISLKPTLLALVPITSKLLTELETQRREVENSLETSIFERLTPDLVDWILSLSKNSTIAYVEAEFSGGSGGHCAAVWQNGEIALNPLLTRWRQPNTPLNVTASSEMAINKALRLLGIKALGQTDEFEVVGLGRCRHTEKWL